MGTKPGPLFGRIAQCFVICIILLNCVETNKCDDDDDVDDDDITLEIFIFWAFIYNFSGPGRAVGLACLSV